MLKLTRNRASSPPGAGDTVRQHDGFVAVRASAPRKETLLSVREVSRLLEPGPRQELVREARALTRGGTAVRVELAGVTAGDQLVLAAVIGLLLHFKAPGAEVSIRADAGRLNPDLWQLFERAVDKPGRLLKTVNHALFARMHYLVGQRDHAAIEALAPLLPFIEIIADGDKKLAQRLAQLLNISKRNVQLMVTRRCHLRCVYCPADKRDEDLSLEHAKRAADLLFNSDSDRIRLDFAGGEPLLRKDWLRELITHTHDRAQALGKRDTYYLVTNAIELSEDFCEFLSKFDVELEISIDGDELNHNRNKVALDKSLNPYRTLLTNFQHVRQRDIHYNAVVVFTPDTLPDLTRNLEHVLSLGFSNIAINYAIGYIWEDAAIDRYVETLAEFVKRHDMLNGAGQRGVRGKSPSADVFFTNLQHKSEPTVLNSELMVDTDGSLHLLSEWQFKQHLRKHPAPFGFSLTDVQSIDEVFFTKAQVYYLLHGVYRSDDPEKSPTGDDHKALGIVHNSVETGLKVQSRLRELLGSLGGETGC